MFSGTESIASQFIQLYNSEPLLFRAPGRINLIGEHTDYNNGFVMPGAIDKEIHFAMNFSDDAFSTIFSFDKKESVSVSEFKKEREPDWLNYLAGIVWRLKEKGYGIRPFNCVFGGNIPVGSGLSSSAALECGFIVALNELNDLKIPRLEMVQIAQWAEHHFAGVRCGIMDQFSSMMGRKGQVFMLDCRDLEFTYLPLLLEDSELLLLDTHVKHSLAGTEYNVRRTECEQGVQSLQKVLPEVSSLRDVTADDVKRNPSLLPGKLFQRCLYVTEENERVRDAADMLKSNDLAGFGKKMFESHEGLSRMYEVSCNELDFLVEEARTDIDVLGSRMMGGGFGGCTINLVRKSGTKKFIERLAEKYLDAYQVELSAYKVSISEGAGRINAGTAKG